jgi:hypothetical protein
MMYNDGYCPECELSGKKVKLVLNEDDFWECPVSNLVLSSKSLLYIAILPERGKGRYRTQLTEAPTQVRGQILTKSKTQDFRYADEENYFKNEDELKIYLNQLVEPMKNYQNSIKYYANLAHLILHTTPTIPYKDNKDIIGYFFKNFVLDDYQNKEQSNLIKSRLGLIDFFYSTNLSKSYFSLDDIVESIKEISNSDEDFSSEVEKFIDNLDFENSKEFKLLEKTFGIKKDNTTSKNISLLTKYYYFISGNSFPIFDSLVNDYYFPIGRKFDVDLKNKINKYDLETFFVNMRRLNNKVEDYNKLDNLLWLFGKVKQGNYSLILTKDAYIELIKRIVGEVPNFTKIKSKDKDKEICRIIDNNIDNLREFKVFSEPLIEFIKFVKTV